MTLWIATLALLSVAQGAAAQSPSEDEVGSKLSVYVWTFGPGDDPWEKWGHNAIEIVDPSAPKPEDQDLAYNWGEFPEFTNGFFLKFLQGRLWYSIGSHPRDLTVRYYEYTNRSISRQKINLTPRQKLKLRDKLQFLVRAENRNYLYNYYTINCSTKVRDAIDEATDGALAKSTRNVPSGASYRFHTDRLDADDLWLYVVLQGVLGHPVDRPIDLWAEMFVPEKLHDRLSEATVVIDGQKMPLVIVEKGLPSTRPPERDKPPGLPPWMLVTGLLLAVLYAGMAHCTQLKRINRWAFAVLSLPWLGAMGFGGWLMWWDAIRDPSPQAPGRLRILRWTFVVLTTPWLLLMAIGGAVMWWGWLATDHEVARSNENVMQVSVLAFPLLIMLPRLALGKKWGATWTRYLVWVMAGLSVLGLVLKVLPWFYQSNFPIIALCLPVNAALAYAVWVMRPAAAVEPRRTRQMERNARTRA